jgi:glycosyltransferase involved in cell wall biosynthesis
VKAVQSLQVQTLAASHFEIIVVDNGSSDDTADQVGYLKKGVANLRYVFEERPGLSIARNTGVAKAIGQIVAFLDDDAVATPYWLKTLLLAYEENPTAWVVGGRINLEWEASPPDWIHPDLYGFLGLLDLGENTRPVVTKERLGGGNISIRRQILDDLGGFSLVLGRNPHSLLSGEEVELMDRVRRKGGVCLYSPGALVYHYVTRQRMQKSFFINRSYWQGYTEAVQAALENRKGGAVFSVVRQSLLVLARGGAAAVLYPFSSEAEQLRRRCMVESRRGALRHARDHAARRCECWNLDERPVQY